MSGRLPADLAPGAYQLVAGVYQRDNKTPLLWPNGSADLPLGALSVR